MKKQEDGLSASQKPAPQEGNSGSIDMVSPTPPEADKVPHAASNGLDAEDRPHTGTGAAISTDCETSRMEGVAAQLLRNAFAQHLRNSPYLPPGLARTLANDVETVPLELSGAQGSGNGHNGAAAAAGYAIGGGAVVTSLTALADATYKLSLHLRGLLIARHNLPPELADRITLHGREGTLARAIHPNHGPQELMALVSCLAENGGLTPSFLLRALCLGHLAVFEIALARLTNISREEASSRIGDDDSSAFSELYKRAGLPADLYRAFRVAVKVHRRLPDSQAEPWHHGNTIQVIESLVKEYEHLSPEGLEHVLSQLARAPRIPDASANSFDTASA